MVLKQHRDLDDILFIDASKGFVKDGTSNRLRASDIKRIADTVRDRVESERFSRRVSRDEIRSNGYNLNIPRYVDSGVPTEKFDIYATVFGGVPDAEIDALAPWWDTLPTLRDDIFAKFEDKPYSSLRCQSIADAIRDNSDVRLFKEKFSDAFAGFSDALHRRLIENLMSVNELSVVEEIADDIFRRMESVPIVDKYAAYQALADNWPTVSGDIEIIQTEGLDACRVVEVATKMSKDKDGSEVEVPDGLKGRVIPFWLIQLNCFQKELDSIDQKKRRLDGNASDLEEKIDALSGTDGGQEAFFDKDDNTKLDKKKVTAAAKSKDDGIEKETKELLKEIVGLWKEQTDTRKEIKNEEVNLLRLTKEKIENLSDSEVDSFLRKKWIDPICYGIEKTLLDALTGLEKELCHLTKKYETSLTSINQRLQESQDELSSLVGELTGDEFSIKGLAALVNGVKKESDI